MNLDLLNPDRELAAWINGVLECWSNVISRLPWVD